MTNTATTVDVDALKRALDAFAEANFECGEWDRNESDEPYDVVHARALKAETAVWGALGLPQPIGPDDKPIHQDECPKCGADLSLGGHARGCKLARRRAR